MTNHPERPGKGATAIGAPWALTPWLLAGFLAVFAAIAAALVVGPANLRSVYGAADMVSHTHEVRAALQQLLGAITDAETSQRGFIITADEGYLEPYNRSSATLETDIARVRELTADNPAQQEDLKHLLAAATDRMGVLAENIKIRREYGFDAAQERITEGAGRRAMDDMRAIVARMQEREDALLAARSVASERRYRLAQVIGFGTSTLALFVLGLLFAGTRRFGAERRKTEQLAERLDVTLESIGDGVITADDQGRMLRMNPVAQALTGWAESDAAGRRIEEILVLVNEHTRGPAENPISRVLREGVTVGLANHTILISKDGRETPIDDSAAPIKDAKGRTVGVIMVFRDITERHRAELERANLTESERLARQEAETANRTKDEFLAMVSHELRTPLHAILGWADMLRAGTLSDERRGRAIEAVYSNAIRQTKLIDELLDVSRIMSGKLQLEFEPLDLTAILRSAVDVIQPSADAKGVALTIDADPDVGPFLGDQARMQQILGNLLSNAIKFTPQGGAVRVTLGLTDGAIALVVADSGQGIPSEFLPFVFEPFRQVNQLTTRQHGGLGLGLSIVRHLVQAHGGTVRAESPGAGQGSTFTVRLPASRIDPRMARNEVAPAKTIPVLADTARLRDIVVLAVDDDRDSLDLVSAALEAQGAVVRTASSADEAVAILGSTAVQAILCDIAMPGVDGYTLIRRLRADEAGGQPHVPAAALTSLAREDDRREAIRAGFDLHLTKPIDAPSLVEAVARLAKGPRRSG